MVLDQARAAILLAAIFADTVNLESVTCGRVMVPAADLLLQLIYFLGEKFHRTAAFGADHVMVAAAIVLMLIARNAVVERDFARQSALGEQLECAIDRGITDAGIFLLHQAVQFVSRKVVARFQERAQDGIALRRLFQPHFLEMLVKNLLSLAYHFAGDGRLVINTLLQHEVSG